MTEPQFNRIAKALADPRRFAILRTIAAAGQKEVACQALCRRFDITPATICHHLKELTAAGLVRDRREGQCMYLTARRSVVRRYTVLLQRRLLGGGERVRKR